MREREMPKGEIENRMLTERQREVLEAALALLVDAGETLTMGAVAQRASCSKETLYKWFGGRRGLLTATVQWQASKVRMAKIPPGGLDRKRLFASLEDFARDWLTVLSGPTSVALNRIAVAMAGQGEPGTSRDDLGAIVLANGPFAMRRRLGSTIEAGRAAGLLAVEDADGAFRTFFGLVVGDVQIRLLLGDTLGLDPEGIARDARRATEQFFALYGAKEARAEASAETQEKTA